MGDALAGYVAARCGLLTGGFEAVCAVNENDALARLFNTGRMTRKAAVATPSPAMDISVPSNFERILYEITGRDADAVRRTYAAYAQSGDTPLPDGAASKLGCSGLSAAAINNAETLEEMERFRKETGWLICPHTAVGPPLAEEGCGHGRARHRRSGQVPGDGGRGNWPDRAAARALRRADRPR